MCVGLAALFNSIMDIANFKPHRFNRWLWWKHDWKRKYVDGDPLKGRVKWFGRFNKPVQLIDGFHFSKFAMVFLIVTAVVVVISSTWWHYLIGYIIGYIIWNGTFMLMYKYIL